MRLNFFNFKKYDNDSFLLTNDFGQYLFLDRDEFKTTISGELSADSELGKKLLLSKRNSSSLQMEEFSQ